MAGFEGKGDIAWRFLHPWPRNNSNRGKSLERRKDEARRIAANVGKLPELLSQMH
jgi:hypothetical protein